MVQVIHDPYVLFRYAEMKMEKENTRKDEKISVLAAGEHSRGGTGEVDQGDHSEI